MLAFIFRYFARLMCSSHNQAVARQMFPYYTSSTALKNVDTKMSLSLVLRGRSELIVHYIIDV